MKEELNVSNVKQWTYPFIFLPVSFPVLIAPSVDVFMWLLRSGFSGDHFFVRLDYGIKVNRLLKEHHLTTYRKFWFL